MTALSGDLVTALPATVDTRSVLAPVGVLTTTLDRTAPLVPELLAPVTAVPGTLLGPSGLVDATGALLVGTVTGLTDTTTALTGTVGALGRAVLGPPLATLTGPPGEAVLATRSGSPTLAAAPTSHVTPLAAATRAAVANEQGPDLGPAPMPASSTVGAWSTSDAAAAPAARPELPGAPALWAPLAPAAPVGAAGAAASGGAVGPAGVLPDLLAMTAVLAGLVLVACGRRGTWWFPEVVIGPD